VPIHKQKQLGHLEEVASTLGKEKDQFADVFFVLELIDPELC